MESRKMRPRALPNAVPEVILFTQILELAGWLGNGRSKDLNVVRMGSAEQVSSGNLLGAVCCIGKGRSKELNVAKTGWPSSKRVKRSVVCCAGAIQLVLLDDVPHSTACCWLLHLLFVPSTFDAAIAVIMLGGVSRTVLASGQAEARQFQGGKGLQGLTRKKRPGKSRCGPAAEWASIQWQKVSTDL
eukprot:1161268-Pelagomonas_calceolata.AAC.13